MKYVIYKYLELPDFCHDCNHFTAGLIENRILDVQNLGGTLFYKRQKMSHMSVEKTLMGTQNVGIYLCMHYVDIYFVEILIFKLFFMTRKKK